jgi:hypothetical protein
VTEFDGEAVGTVLPVGVSEAGAGFGRAGKNAVMLDAGEGSGLGWAFAQHKSKHNGSKDFFSEEKKQKTFILSAGFL